MNELQYRSACRRHHGRTVLSQRKSSLRGIVLADLRLGRSIGGVKSCACLAELTAGIRNGSSQIPQGDIAVAVWENDMMLMASSSVRTPSSRRFWASRISRYSRLTPSAILRIFSAFPFGQSRTGLLPVRSPHEICLDAPSSCPRTSKHSCPRVRKWGSAVAGSKFSRVLPVPTLCHLFLRFHVGAARLVALLPEAAQILCTFEGKYLYNLPGEMHI